jgi:hypothetical protein
VKNFGSTLTAFFFRVSIHKVYLIPKSDLCSSNSPEAQHKRADSTLEAAPTLKPFNFPDDGADAVTMCPCSLKTLDPEEELEDDVIDFYCK